MWDCLFDGKDNGFDNNEMEIVKFRHPKSFEKGHILTQWTSGRSGLWHLKSVRATHFSSAVANHGIQIGFLDQILLKNLFQVFIASLRCASIRENLLLQACQFH